MITMNLLMQFHTALEANDLHEFENLHRSTDPEVLSDLIKLNSTGYDLNIMSQILEEHR